MTRFFLAAVLAAFAFASARAQDEPKASDVQALIALFKTEREDAAKSFSVGELKAADETAAKAETALADGNTAAAARLVKDARWLLPFKPAGLPKNVSRVIGSARLRHADRVNALAYSPDGNRLASASRDGTVRVWDLGNGREVVAYRGHAEAGGDKAEDTNVFRVAGLTFSPDGKRIASSGGPEIHIWDAATGELKSTLKGHKGVVRAIAFGKDEKVLASGSDDKTVILWDLPKEKPSYTSPEQSSRVEAIAWGANGRMIGTVNAAGEMFVYAPATERKLLLSLPITDGNSASYGIGFAGDGVVTCGGDSKAKLTTLPAVDGTGGGGTTVRSYLGHSDKVYTLATSADGKTLVTGSKDKTVRVWDVATGKQTWSFQGHLGIVTAVAIRPDGRQLASGGDDGSVKIWPLSPADEHRSFTDATEPLWTATYSPNGDKFAAAGADKVVRVYDASTGKLLKPLSGHTKAVTALAFLPGDKLATAAGDKLVKLWNLADGTAVDLAGHTSAVLAVGADPEGKLVVSGSADRSVRGWDPADPKKAKWTWTGKSAVTAVAPRKGAKQIAIGTADGGLTLLGLEADVPKILASLGAHTAGVAAVTWSPDGTRVATCGGDGAVRLWSVPESGTPTPLARFDPPQRSGGSSSPVSAIAFSTDGRYLAAGGADSVTRIWDVQTGAELRGFRGHTDWVTAVAFRPDGSAVLSAGVDKAVRAFEMARPEMTGGGGHSQPIRCIAIDRSGTRIATGSEDKNVKVWDLETGREIATLTGAGDALNAVAFVGKDTVVAAGDDQKVRWWSLKPVQELRSQATGRAFNIVASADGAKVGLVWALRDDKQAAFEVFPGDGSGGAAQVMEKGRKLTCACLSADATLGITGGEDGVLRIWNLGTKDRIGGDWPLFVKAVADIGMTADKSTVAAIDLDGFVKVADVNTRESKPKFRAVAAGVNGLVVAPNGSALATLSADGEVKAWDMDGKELRKWTLPTVPNAAAFTPDGKKLVTANRDGTLYVLDMP